jgi:hypothetical protein
MKIRFNINKILIVAGAGALICLVAFFFWWNKEITISNGISIGAQEEAPKSSISGKECANYSRRPLAVMLAGDPETRPLSGIGQADIVFEMPVAPNNITRFMAVFQCEDPKDIGSIRSAREDFIPLASSFGAVYAHWGGERDALNKLNNGIINNIDAMKYEGTVFYRKKSLPRPHNGFTTIELLLDKARALGYELKDTFSGYPHSDKEVKKNLSNLVSSIDIGYPDQYKVRWQYDEAANSYLRYRGSSQERDANTGEPVRADVVVVMKTSSRILNQDYIRVDVSGEGEAVIYQNGAMISGKWKKDAASLSSKLYFYDTEGKEIEFLPGRIWVQITTS